MEPFACTEAPPFFDARIYQGESVLKHINSDVISN